MSSDLERRLLLVGLSHRSAPLELRERCSVSPDRLPQRLDSLLALGGVEEALIVSTCNRTELYVCGDRAADLEPALRDLCFREAGADNVYAFNGVHALIHTFRVASGLDSLVLGESQILAQLKAAADTARGHGSLGRDLDKLVRAALTVGKRVRTETDLGQGTLSVARVGVDIAHRVFGGFENNRALIVGAGETGLLVARHLRDQNIGTLVFANRTVERAVAAAEELGGLHCGLDALDREVGRADAVFVCVDNSGHVVTFDHAKQAKTRKRHTPLLMVDLSVPRGVDPRVAKLANLLYYDLDDLAHVVEEHRRGRERAGEESEDILVAEVHKFLSLRSYAAAAPAIAELHQRFDKIREEVLDDVTGGASSPDQVKLAHELSKRLLDASLSQMKESIRRMRSTEELGLEYQRFLDGLESDPQ
ncbi:MAG: glutamyl-tRNA reductase [Planctomycetota bacterium]